MLLLATVGPVVGPAVQDAAAQIQDRLFNAALSGEFSPTSFKPMTGIGIAREVLDAVDGANKRFLASLRDEAQLFEELAQRIGHAVTDGHALTLRQSSRLDHHGLAAFTHELMLRFRVEIRAELASRRTVRDATWTKARG